MNKVTNPSAGTFYSILRKRRNC